MAETSAHVYNDKFFKYIEGGSRRSASLIIQLLLNALKIKSVLDVGCGRGIWVDEWARAGVADVVGVDGAYIENPPEQFAARDLSMPVDLGRRFDLVQSLEVGEHIPAVSAEVFVDTIVAHGDIVVFSAAVPGQGGEFHVNEQPYEYWRDKFVARDFLLFDFIRPIIAKDRRIEPWYRYNTLLFVRNRAVEALPAIIRSTEIAPNADISRFEPPVWRLRKSILRQLPRPWIERIARVKHAAVRAGLPFPS